MPGLFFEWRMADNGAMNETHPFAQYVRILGRGKKGARSLSFDEAREAMSMILADEVEPVQLGAFLMLLRVKEESPEELAGFVSAARNALTLPAGAPRVQLDWSSYAGKRRQLPWFILSALLLAQQGISILMHGTRGFKDDRVYTPDALLALGLPLCRDFREVEKEIALRNFAFIPLEHFSPRLKEILNLRHLLGLRSPVNTLLRMLNPLAAPYLLQGIFHPGYRAIHQQAALLLEQPHMAVFKGEGGETERSPDRPCALFTVHGSEAGEEEWPALLGKRHLKDEKLDVSRLGALWRGELEDEYGSAAVTGTAAIVLRLLGRATSIAEAEVQAKAMWVARDKERLRAEGALPPFSKGGQGGFPRSDRASLKAHRS